jgi:hypothetical protein
MFVSRKPQGFYRVQVVNVKRIVHLLNTCVEDHSI